MALILGSGFSEFAAAMDNADVLAYADIPGFPLPRSRVIAAG